MKANGKIQVLALIALLIIIFIVSVFLFNVENIGNRRVLYFEAMGGTGLYTESRRVKEYYPHQEKDIHVRQFIQELLLGPVGNGYRALFRLDTNLESCFIQDDVLFINLSREALFPGRTTSSTERGVEMLIFNIKKNFSWIKSVEVYIDGNKAYDKVV